MLKITHTENNFYLEYFQESLEIWISKRILLCLRAATGIYIEPSVASFLIPANLPYLNDLETLKAENEDLSLFLLVMMNGSKSNFKELGSVLKKMEKKECLFVL